MSFYQDRMTGLVNELRKSFNDNFDKEQINKLAESLQKFSSVMQQVAADISTHFFTEEMMEYIAETRESEKLSQPEFEEKYSYEMEVCKQLGRAGWVVSEHSNPREIEEWYDLLSNQEDAKIITYFEGDNNCILRRFTKGYYIKQPNMDCQPTEFTALSRHRAVFSWAGKGGIPICGA